MFSRFGCLRYIYHSDACIFMKGLNRDTLQLPIKQGNGGVFGIYLNNQADYVIIK